MVLDIPTKCLQYIGFHFSSTVSMTRKKTSLECESTVNLSRKRIFLGFADMGDDLLPFTTLMYSTGNGFKYNVEEEKVTRPDLSEVDTTSYGYRQVTPVPTKYASHAGEDVAIYATGQFILLSVN